MKIDAQSLFIYPAITPLDTLTPLINFSIPSFTMQLLIPTIPKQSSALCPANLAITSVSITMMPFSFLKKITHIYLLLI